MAVEVKVPSVGESVTSGVLGKWHKQNGEVVSKGEVLLEIETEKVTSEIYAEVDGILKRMVEEGAEVQIGQVIATINGADVPASTQGGPPPAKTPAKPPPDAKKPPVSLPSPAEPPPMPEIPSEKAASPAARNLMAEQNISFADVQGVGEGGLVTKEAILTGKTTEQPAAPPVIEKMVAPISTPPQPATPPVLEKEEKASASTPPPTAPTTSSSSERKITRRKMSPLRRKLADRLVGAQNTAAILTTFNEANMSNIIAMRRQFQDRFTARHGVKLGFMSFFVKAVVHALKHVPNINARIEDDEIVQNHFYDIGIAIGTEKGLLVPVLRNTDKLSHAGIEKGIQAFSQKAREGKITFEDLEGGVFTISNGGVYGSLLSTPILNPPQSGILGMHAIQERPVAVQGRVEVAPMMYLALSYDHRIVDGQQAVTFLVRVKEFIENPAVELLEL